MKAKVKVGKAVCFNHKWFYAGYPLELTEEEFEKNKDNLIRIDQPVKNRGSKDVEL